MAKFGDNKQLEDLSSAIDSINKGERPTLTDADSQQLAEVAMLLKLAGPSPAIIDNITNDLKKETAGTKKKRRLWLLSGTTGIIAASLLVFALSLKPQQIPPEAPFVLPPVGGIVIESLPENSLQAKQTAPSGQGVPSANLSEEKKRVEERSEPAGTKADAANEKTVASRGTEPAHRTASLALAGRKPDQVTVDKNSGVVRKVYGIGGRDVIVTQKPVAAAAPAQNQRYMIMAAPDATEDKTALRAKQERTSVKVNKITRAVKGVEVTIEGEHSEEDLAKIADELVEEADGAKEKE